MVILTLPFALVRKPFGTRMSSEAKRGSWPPPHSAELGVLPSTHSPRATPSFDDLQFCFCLKFKGFKPHLYTRLTPCYELAQGYVLFIFELTQLTKRTIQTQAVKTL